jgi:hypothetical protein
METVKSESLIRLLDDPDQMVYDAVSREIELLGSDMLPGLESAARDAMTPDVHERIERIIRVVRFNQLKQDISAWIRHPQPRLIDGAWLMARFQFPELNHDDFIKQLKPIRDEIWLEISDSLTALEKIRVINLLLFKNDRIALNEDHPTSPGNNYINLLLESGKGNEVSISLLYAIIGQELGIPLFFTDMPDYPVLAYVDTPYAPESVMSPSQFEVLFYVNPSEKGTVHSRFDLTNYVVNLSLPLLPRFFSPGRNLEFIKLCFNQLAVDYELAGSKIRSAQVLDLVNLWK